MRFLLNLKRKYFGWLTSLQGQNKKNTNPKKPVF